MKKYTLLYVTLMAFSLAGFSTARAQTATVAPTSTPAVVAPAIVAPASDAVVLDVTSTTGYESEYVFRGVKLSNDILTQDVNVAYKFIDLDVEGIWNAVPADRKASLGEVDFTPAIVIPLKAASLSIGETIYDYPNKKNVTDGSKNTTEDFVQLSYNAVLNPYVKIAYNNTLRTGYGEAGVSQKFDVPFLKGVFLTPGAVVGWDGQRNAVLTDKFTESYQYVGGSLALGYTYRAANLSLSANRDYVSGATGTDKSQLTWYGASVGFKF